MKASFANRRVNGNVYSYSIKNKQWSSTFSVSTAPLKEDYGTGL